MSLVSIAATVALPIIKNNISWSSVIGAGRHVCGLAGSLMSVKYRNVRDVLEELDLELQVAVLTDVLRVAVDLEPESNDLDGSWIFEHKCRSAEQRLAGSILDVLEDIKCLLSNINADVVAHERKWIRLWALDVDDKLETLKRKRAIFDKRCRMFWNLRDHFHASKDSGSVAVHRKQDGGLGQVRCSAAEADDGEWIMQSPDSARSN
jgi:hypothetical protein